MTEFEQAVLKAIRDNPEAVIEVLRQRMELVIESRQNYDADDRIAPGKKVRVCLSVMGFEGEGETPGFTIRSNWMEV